MTQLVSVAGPGIQVDGTTFTEGGSGVVIGNGLVLTAGHVVFEYNQKRKSNPSTIGTGNIVHTGINIASDFRSYQNLYAVAASNFWANPPSDTTKRENVYIEKLIHNDDSVLIRYSGASVASTDDGIVLFLNPEDMVVDFGHPTGLTDTLGSTASISRVGNSSATVNGNVTSVGAGGLVFDQGAFMGDSGGAYILTYDSRKYVIGTQSSTRALNVGLPDPLPIAPAYGTYFTQSDYDQITPILVGNQRGNLTNREPTNLIVGSVSNDAATGSGRADIILGRGGGDVLDGGDLIPVSQAEIAANTYSDAWGNDQLFGGADDDTFLPGLGADLFHGGERGLAGSAASDLSLDGVDSISYQGITSADPDKGIKIDIRAASLPASYLTYQSNPDFSSAIFVDDQGRDGAVDTLISIEKIAATSADDIVMIETLEAARLANTNGQGGLAEIDLAGQSTDPQKGDLVDLSRLVEGTNIDWEQASITIAATENADRKLVIKDAENLKGGRGIDIFSISANNAHVDGGAGNDQVTLTATASGAEIDGGKGNDVIDARALGGTRTDANGVVTFATGDAVVNYKSNDGLDRIKNTYNFTIGSTNLSNVDARLSQGYDPRGVAVVKFLDLATTDVEMYWDATLLDQSTSPLGDTTYLYHGNLWLVQKNSASGIDGINLGDVIGFSSHVDIHVSATYLDIPGLPDIQFTDGSLAFFEGGPNVAAFHVGAPPPPVAPAAPTVGSASVNSPAPTGMFPADMFGATGYPDTTSKASQPARSADQLAEAIAAFRPNGGSDILAAQRDSDGRGNWLFAASQRMVEHTAIL